MKAGTQIKVSARWMVVTLLVALFQGTGIAEAQPAATLKADVVTGLNRLFGQPRFVYPLPPPFDIAGFQMIDEFNPAGPNPLPLVSTSPDDTVLASTVDPFIDQLFPLPVTPLVDPAALNVPIRDIPTWVETTLSVRAPLPFQAAAPIVSQSQSGPTDPSPITKGDWFKASGTLKIRCNPQGNTATIAVKDLIPNRVYTVWAIFFLPQLPGPGVPGVFPMPFGGAPNAYVTDADGNATFERRLNFCPLESLQDQGVPPGIELLSIITHLHSDHVLYGAVPIPLFGGLPPGTVLHSQLEWNLGFGEPQEIQ